MTSILFMTNAGEPPPGGIAGVGDDELMRAGFIYLVSRCNFLIFKLFSISACQNNVGALSVEVCGG